jgi:hypothetical protein
MIIEPEDLRIFLEGLCGTSAVPLLLARDPDAPTGWRQWTDEDSDALCAWVSAKAEESATDDNGISCYNAKGAAKALNVSVPKLQIWLRRREYPIPHIKDGRKITIPTFLLKEWLRAEATKTIEDRP